MLTVREIKEEDIPYICEYWMGATSEHLLGMGADPAKIPSREVFQNMLENQLKTPYPKKQGYCIIWELDGQAVGHCNTNKIIFGQEAYMHLHLWNSPHRRKGMGEQLVRKSLFYFFKNLEIKVLYCEPYALNPAPNKTLKKVGFKFVKEYLTIPGSLNFEQIVSRWEMPLEKFNLIQ